MNAVESMMKEDVSVSLRIKNTERNNRVLLTAS